MEKNYVAPPEACRKLKLARGLQQNVYILISRKNYTHVI